MANKNRKEKTNFKGTSRSRSKKPVLALLLLLLICAYFFIVSDQGPFSDLREATSGNTAPASGEENGASGGSAMLPEGVDPDSLPEYEGRHYTEINGGKPEFPADVLKKAGLGENGKEAEAFEYYGELDSLGRCTAAYGCLGEETMPEKDEERGDISSIHPTGWAKAQNWERCHLIAWALAAENANPRNLITGTHYLNNDGMRPFEEETEHYIWNTGNHVLYMVKPWFSGDELVARGVQMTAKSVEDGGKGISFNIYLFNVTPGADIDYNSGIVTTEEQASQGARLYVLNRRSGVFHYPSCDGAKDISPKNREEVTATRSELTAKGYVPCGLCEP